MTAEQINHSQTGAVDVVPAPEPKPSSDELRHQILALFDSFKEHLKGYHDYAERVSALAVEYHKVRLAEAFPGAKFEEGVLAISLDARETPKSLDTKLAQLHGVAVKRVVFDQLKSTYHLFV